MVFLCPVHGNWEVPKGRGCLGRKLGVIGGDVTSKIEMW